MSYDFVSVVLPVWRQAAFIDSVVRSYDEALAKLSMPHETLLVVNGDGDPTMDICRDLERDLEPVRVLTSDPGWGHAVKAGVQAAKGDLICYTNSARTRTEDLVLCIVYATAFPGTVIKADRRLRDSWIRRLGSLVYNIECRVLFDLAVFDVNATPKVFPSSYEPLRNLSRSDDVIDAEFNAVCRDEHYPMLEVPIFGVERHGGKSSTNMRSAVRMLSGAYKLSRARRAAR